MWVFGDVGTVCERAWTTIYFIREIWNVIIGGNFCFIDFPGEEGKENEGGDRDATGKDAWQYFGPVP